MNAVNMQGFEMSAALYNKWNPYECNFNERTHPLFVSALGVTTCAFQPSWKILEANGSADSIVGFKSRHSEICEMPCPGGSLSVTTSGASGCQLAGPRILTKLPLPKLALVGAKARVT